MRPKREWNDLSARQRAAAIAIGSVELVLTATAAVDLIRRPRTQVVGAKALWWPVLFVQPIGPIAYLVLGRRRHGRPGRR